MKRFEEWLVVYKDQINTAAYGLFEDSLRCMKFGIDRPAYLMAYQGLLRHIREVIVFGERPHTFKEAAWNDVLKGLTLDNPDIKWDDNTYDRIRQGAEKNSRHSKVVNMPDEARNKFPYWRELRNVCAHNKEYIFLKAHTLTLYAFIEQFLLKISVEGGMQTLLNQLDDFYNPVMTPPGGDDGDLITRIPSMVELGDLEHFLKEVVNIHRKYHLDSFASFFLHCYDVLSGTYKEELKRIVERNDTLLRQILQADPERVLTFVDQPEKIRKMWIQDSFDFINGTTVVAHLMEAGKLSGSDKDEYLGKLLSFLYRLGNSLHEEEYVIEVFKRHGLFDKFLNEYFDISFTGNIRNMSKICQSIPFYASIMSHLDIGTDDVYVRHIVEVFGGMYPYTLRDWFRANLMSDNNFASQLRQRIIDLGLEMPKSLAPIVAE